MNMGPNSLKEIKDAFAEPPGWMSHYDNVKGFFQTHLDVMFRCDFIINNLEAMRIGDRDRSVFEENRISNFGVKWRDHGFTEWEEFYEEFMAAAPDWEGWKEKPTGPGFMVPIALALTFLFVAQGLN